MISDADCWKGLVASQGNAPRGPQDIAFTARPRPLREYLALLMHIEIKLGGILGIEPRTKESQSSVLPLHHIPHLTNWLSLVESNHRSGYQKPVYYRYTKGHQDGFSSETCCGCWSRTNLWANMSRLQSRFANPQLNGGECPIWTDGRLQTLACFQDKCIRPLCQLSIKSFFQMSMNNQQINYTSLLVIRKGHFLWYSIFLPTIQPSSRNSSTSSFFTFLFSWRVSL